MSHTESALERAKARFASWLVGDRTRPPPARRGPAAANGARNSAGPSQVKAAEVTLIMSPRGPEGPEERRRRYLRLAAEANRISRRFRRMEMREACLRMAQSWLSLAADLDARLRAQAQPAGEPRPETTAS
jgi:hypothetical protein